MSEIRFNAEAIYLTLPRAAGGDLVHLRRDPSGNISPAEVAKNFEQIFIQQLIREMSNSLEEGFFGSEASGHIYRGLFESILSQKIADTGGIGLAPIVEQAIQRQISVSNGVNAPTERQLGKETT